jgi:hypothetical protein
VAEPVPGGVPPTTTAPDSFDKLLAQLEAAPHNDDVRASLTLFGPGPVAPGDPAPGGPPAAAPPVSVQDNERVGDVVRGGLFIPVTVQ